MKKKRWIAVVTVTAMLLSFLGVKNDKNSPVSMAKEKTSNYIVMATGNNNLEEITESYCDTEQIINEENVRVCKLTKSEAKELQKSEKEIIVEKDTELQTSSKKVYKNRKKGKSPEWNFRAIHAEKAAGDKDEKKIKVAIIDSGVDDYNDIVLTESINLIPGEEEVSPLYVDVTGHGSSVAGIIAAADNGEGITGIAPEVELYSAKVFDSENRSTISRVVDAIYWAIDKNVNIINMSFGTTSNSQALHQAIRDAENNGILLIAAAGNDRQVEYPAAYDEVMAVGSVNTEGEVSKESAVGEQLEIVAPGEQICSTGAFGGTIIAEGTSMSAPHITGIAAKLWGRDRMVSANFIRQLLNASANQFTVSSKCGNGLVDYSYAKKIYKEFKNSYREGVKLEKNEINIEENKNEIPSFQEVDYVEGRWSLDAHKAAISNSKLTKSEINVIKRGVVYPDTCGATKQLSKHPYWHGGYKCSNYISSYIYATNMAITLKKGKDIINANVPAGLSSSNKESMRTAVKNIKWSKELSTISKKNKCLFVWGMAIHDAMDIYSHSAGGRINGKWQHLDHTEKYKKNPGNGLADRTDSNAFPERYVTAYKVAQKSLNTYVNGKNGNVYDFIPSGGYKDAGITWVIIKLRPFMAELNVKAANLLKSYSTEKELK